MKKSLKARIAFGQELGLSRQHASLLARLDTPHKIQDYLNTVQYNFEHDGDSCLSVAGALDKHHAHCIEGAFIAACALWINGERPLLLDLKAKNDDDHVVTLFRQNGCWGAISKTNHIWLRWRDPVYKTLRELAMSYFHEYVTGTSKTLMSYSAAFDLSPYDPVTWVSGSKPCWDIAWALDISRHHQLITPAQARNIRPRDAVELKAGKIVEYQSNKRRK